MEQRDPASFSSKEKYLVKKHKHDVARFERIYGPVSVVLGWPSKERQAGNDDGQVCTHKGVGPSTSAACRDENKKVDGVVAAGALRASAGAAGGSKTSPKVVPGAKREGKPPAASPKGPQKGAIRRTVSGGGQNSKLKGPRKSSSLSTAGRNPASTSNEPQKGTIKRARSGDDQPTSSTKKMKKSTSLDGNFRPAVIDRSDPDGKISPELWQLVEGRFLDEIAAYSGSPDDVSFKGADWTRGIKIVNCGNKNSFEFLRVCGLAITGYTLFVPSTEDKER
ncbi:uncharacterized protein LOC124418548 [Lucilia cuprina]|uniref:uncharacterized protein LOC124418548 n=1 Tax=Lucilia cuprina TaxID=7375 RepID=UPI001F0518C3|nr:uncharacterized protein LOC124418548 [Lucilia cuprina]